MLLRTPPQAWGLLRSCSSRIATKSASTSLGEQKLGEIGAILTGHAGDERDLAC